MKGRSPLSSVIKRLNTTAENGSDFRLLWIADENFAASPLELNAVKNFTTVITNRFDIAEVTRACNIKTVFSDFDVTQLTESFDTVIYRVSKERHVSHRCLNIARERLKERGRLILCGKKQEGIKTYFEKAVKILGFQGGLEKDGDWYLADLIAGHAGGSGLDDGEYDKLRYIADCFGYQLYSKPGVYGWKTVDAGSALLADCLHDEFSYRDLARKKVLDLGCGSGYLTLLAASCGFGEITATDNNAAAIKAIEYNCGINSIRASIHADDCGANLAGQFAYLWCNPPFHQGFDVSAELTQKFIQAAHRLLVDGGRGYFVVNAFIPLETLAKSVFKKHDVLQNNKKFKIVRLAK